MYELKKMERYLRVNLLGPGPCRMKKEFTGPRSHIVWETLTQSTSWYSMKPYLLVFLRNSWLTNRVRLVKLTVLQPVKKFPRILWNPKFQNRVHNILPLLSMLSRLNPVHALQSCLRFILTLTSHPHLGLQVVSFVHVSPSKYCLIVHTLYIQGVS